MSCYLITIFVNRVNIFVNNLQFIFHPHQSNSWSSVCSTARHSPPPTAPSGCWKPWTVEAHTHILAHSKKVRRRLRSHPEPMAHGAAWSHLSPPDQWRVSAALTWRLPERSPCTQRTIPANTGITEDLTPAESDAHCPSATNEHFFLPLPWETPSPLRRSWPSRHRQWRSFGGAADFPQPGFRASGEAQGRDNDGQKLLK